MPTPTPYKVGRTSVCVIAGAAAAAATASTVEKLRWPATALAVFLALCFVAMYLEGIWLELIAVRKRLESDADRP